LLVEVLQVEQSDPEQLLGSCVVDDSVKSLEDALLLAKGRDVYISGGYGLFKEALQIVDKMYITEVDLNIEDGDTFFPEFDINDFEVLIGETLGEEVKYTRTFYVRKNELSRFWI
jgi:dihydrofolate reductase (trimethoprim resistance protein)